MNRIQMIRFWKVRMSGLGLGLGLGLVHLLLVGNDMWYGAAYVLLNAERLL